jgi:hypothetical protein
MQLHNVTFHSGAEFCTFGDQRVGGDSAWNKVREILPQSRQSAKLFFSRRNWDSPPHHPQARLPPPPLVPGGGAHLRERGWVLGESQFRRGYLHCGSLYLLYMFFLDITMTILYNIPTVNKDDSSTPSLQIITLWAKLTATVMSLLCTEQKEIKMSLSFLCHCQVKASSSLTRTRVGDLRSRKF